MTRAAVERAAAPSDDRADVALRVESVTRRFGDVTAVSGVSFEARRGQVVGLLGHNGAGKTTLVRLLAGLLLPDSGTLRVHGLDPVTDGATVRRSLGVLPSSQIVDLRLTARENLTFAGRLFGMAAADARRRADELLDEFGLAGRADEKVASYSAGMKQRAALARVLLPSPDVLLLDEPSSALDPVGARELRDHIRRSTREQGRTVVLCTHDLVEASELCDDVLILAEGRVIAAGAPAELAAQRDAGSTVDIECHPDDRRTAAQVLRTASAAPDPHRPNRWRVSDTGPDATSALVAALVRSGVRLHAVEPQRHTLEDMYFSLHAETSTDRGAQ